VRQTISNAELTCIGMVGKHNTLNRFDFGAKACAVSVPTCFYRINHGAPAPPGSAMIQIKVPP
jgi:hypothetical protein